MWEPVNLSPTDYTYLQPEFSLENRFICLNTKFQKKGKLWTYTYSKYN